MLRRSRMAQVSDKRRAGQREYDMARQKAFDRDRGRCQAAAIWAEVECGGRLDPHHIAPQGRFPELRAEVSNMTVLCDRHHFQVHHVDPIRARELGLLK